MPERMRRYGADPQDPVYFLVRFVFGHALIAQSVEHAAVNRGVTGSSPV